MEEFLYGGYESPLAPTWQFLCVPCVARVFRRASEGRAAEYLVMPDWLRQLLSPGGVRSARELRELYATVIRAMHDLEKTAG